MKRDYKIELKELMIKTSDIVGEFVVFGSYIFNDGDIINIYENDGANYYTFDSNNNQYHVRISEMGWGSNGYQIFFTIQEWRDRQLKSLI